MIYLPAVAFCPKADSVISRLVVRKLKKPCLSKMPKCMRSESCGVRSVKWDLTGKRAMSGGQIGFRHSIVPIDDSIVLISRSSGPTGVLQCIV